MAISEEKIKHFENTEHDSTENLNVINYDNNKGENLAEKTSGKVRKILDFFNPVKDFKDIKNSFKYGIKKDINNITNGFKNIFSAKTEIDDNEINLQNKIVDLDLNSDEDFAKYKEYMINYIRDGDKKWNNKDAWRAERVRAESELEEVLKQVKKQNEISSEEEVLKIKKDFQNDSTEELYDRLASSGNDKKKNFAEACINILYNSNELQFDNSNLWTALENLSNNRVSFKNAQELNSREILEKVKEAVELIWSKEYVKKWGIENNKAKNLAEETGGKVINLLERNQMKNIKDTFLKKLPAQIILGEFKETKNLKEKAIYSREIDNNLTYTIYQDDINKLSFQLIDSSNNKKISEIIFMQTEQGWEMIHRLVNSQNIGISGSTFLKQAENCLSILKENDEISGDLMGFSSGQVDVIEWGLKNGYRFSREDDENRFEKIKNGDPNYVTGIDLVDPRDNTEKKNWIVSKQNYEKWGKNIYTEYEDISERFILIKDFQVSNNQKYNLAA